jgi:hypothetical protein
VHSRPHHSMMPFTTDHELMDLAPISAPTHLTRLSQFHSNSSLSALDDIPQGRESRVAEKTRKVRFKHLRRYFGVRSTHLRQLPVRQGFLHSA